MSVMTAVTCFIDLLTSNDDDVAAIFAKIHECLVCHGSQCLFTVSKVDSEDRIHLNRQTVASLLVLNLNTALTIHHHLSCLSSNTTKNMVATTDALYNIFFS